MVSPPMFVTRFRFPAAGGGQLVWSTLLGQEGFPSANGVAILIDHDDVAVVVHRQNGDGTVVLDDFSTGGIAAGHAHLIGA